MNNDDLLIIAGKGEYPRQLLEGARRAGVSRIGVLAFRGQTARSLCTLADFSGRFGVGEISHILDWLQAANVRNVVLAGQISPSALFTTRFDAEGRALLASLRSKCAHSIFGSILQRIESRGLKIIPASSYMDEAIPGPGLLSARAPSVREEADIARGLAAAMAVGTVDVGQTVVVKDGMVTAVEAFEGTNAAIKRGGRLGGSGAVVVKCAREGHDMRFDIPVIGMSTMRCLIRSRISAIAFQANRTILLDRQNFLSAADRHKIAVVSIDSGLPPAPLRP